MKHAEKACGDLWDQSMILKSFLVTAHYPTGVQIF